jgi:hypothetical protein
MTKVKTPEIAIEVTTAYCRKCMKTMHLDKFFQSVDVGYVDSNGYLSVCKSCCNKLYDEEFAITGSMEKALHKLCRVLNVRFSQDAIESTKAHLNTQIENGTNPSPVWSTYKGKLIAQNKSMDKSIKEAMMYDDVSTVYVSMENEKPEEFISDELKTFWGDNYNFKDIQYLETQFATAKQTHRADTFAEITLLKEVCYKLLDMKLSRDAGRPTASSVKELQDLMKTLSISPNAVNASANGKAMDSFGLWVQEIERDEPAQWLEKDGKKFAMLRDVSNAQKYFEDWIVRPLKNFITNSKDFNIDDSDGDDSEEIDFSGIDDGEVGE